MANSARIVMAIYGVLMLLGGSVAYMKAHSKPSLIAGIGSAVVIGVAYAVSRQQPKIGFGIGAAVAVVLILVFVRRIQELSAQNPPGSIGMSIGLCALSAGVALFLLAALIQSRA